MGKKVLVISRDYSSFTGAAAYLFSIIRRMKKHKYILLASPPSDKSFRDYVGGPKNLEIIKIPIPSLRYLYSFVFMLKSIIKSLSMDFDCILGNELVGNVTATIVHFIKRKPLVVIVHNVVYRGKLKPLRDMLLKMIFNSSDMIVINGEKLKVDLQKNFGKQYDSKLVIINPGVEVPPSFNKIKKPKKFIILFVGAIYGYKKGIEYLIMAMPKILKQFDAELWIVGLIFNKKFSNYLDELANKLGVKNDVKFLGYVYDVYSYYDACDVFCLPSYWEAETFGMPVIEAGAMGKPVVVTDIFERAGVAKDGKTGIVIPRKDADAIAKAMIKLAKNKKLRKRLGKNGKEHAKRFSWGVSGRKLESVIEISDRNKKY